MRNVHDTPGMNKFSIIKLKGLIIDRPSMAKILKLNFYFLLIFKSIYYTIYLNFNKRMVKI